MSSSTDQREELDGIAIIGMVCRFPEANTIDEFWTNLKNSKESISFFTDEELIAAGVSPAAIKAPNYVKARAVIDDIDLFDASFFGFNPRAAEATDPQQRIFLECSYEALEHAGYDPATYPGAIGVYAGVSTTNYLGYIYEQSNLRELIGDTQLEIGNDKDFFTTMVSYKLNLRGPSINVNTACSTSLVAVAMACQSLWNYQSDMALAGGASINIPQKLGYFFQEGAVNSSDGHCRVFDAQAEGTVAGNGVGIVVLKRLAEAIADGDHIYAVIKGAAINNDGSGKIGFTAPSVNGQAEVIAMAQGMANIDAGSISYIETHGTATSLGDPIEIAALTKAFRASTAEKQFCAVGSVKSNIGHLDSAAGVAGLIKTALALENNLIPASLHYQQPNPKIDFANSPFFVNGQPRPWVRNGKPRRAGVSSFGFGGTNAHVVVEEAPAQPPSGPSRASQLLVLSARTPTALDQATTNLAQYLRQPDAAKLADVAYTCAVGRHAFEHRRIVVCREAGDAVESLETGAPKRVWTRSVEPKYRPVHFLFSGQGSQQVNMGRHLYEGERVYRETVDRCAARVAGVMGMDLRQVLYPEAGREAAAREQLKQTGVTQPALFITEYALAKLWAHWGVRPQGMLGHSLGEFVAACVAGVLTEEDALRLVAIRGKLMQQLPGGAMLAVGLGESAVRDAVRGRVSIAAINGAELTVVSGTEEAISEVAAELKEQGVWQRQLETSHAFHSAMMEPMMAEFRAAVAAVKLREPQQAYVSSMTGEWVSGADVRSVDYWVEQVRQPVRFWAGLEQLRAGGESVVVEVGPGQGLSVLARSVWGPEAVIVPTLGVAGEEQPSEAERVSAAVGQVWLGGVEIDWSKYYGEERRVRVALPTYPFERKRYWAEAKKNGHKPLKAKTSSGPSSDLADWFYVRSWKQSISPALIKNGDLSDQKFRWLLFDDEGLGSHVAQRLQQEGQDVTVVRTGDQFSTPEDDQFTINPNNPADYDALVKSLHEDDKIPQRIVHLWNVTSKRRAQTESNAFADAQRTGFYSLLSLVRALKQQPGIPPVQLTLISNNTHEVIGDEILCPEKATALGVSRMLNEENPGVTCRNIDLGTFNLDNVREKNQVVSQLLTEVVTNSPDQIVAYRNRQRWVQFLQPVRVEDDNKRRSGLREGGVYVITCETDGPGLKVAEYLARTVNAKLTVIMPASIPRIEDWEEWLATNPHENSIGRWLQEARVIRDSGADVFFTHADKTDAEAMREVLDITSERFGALDGVIHAIGRATEEDAGEVFPEERQLQTKRKELLVLEEVLRERQMDFCVVLSSLAPLVAKSKSIFEAAHADFMSSFVGHEQRSGLTPWIVLSCEIKEQQDDRPFTIKLDEALEAFRRVVRLAQPLQVFVSPVEPRSEIQQPAPDSANATEPAQGQDSVTPYARPNLRNEYVAPRNDQERLVADVWQELLGIKQLGVHDNFFEMGGHSLLAIQVSRRLSDIFKTKLTPDRLIASPTVAKFVESLADSSRNGNSRPSAAVAMQTGGSKRPFFCVHPIGGGIFCFRSLVRHLGPDQPFYGLQARDLSAIGNDGDPYNNLEDLAADYVKSIRAVQPEGPYLLGGFSWGSIVAFEMAQQLRRANQEVPLLVVMDTPTPEIVGKIADFDDATLLLIIARDLGYQRGLELPVTFNKLQQLNPDERFAFVLQELRNAGILGADLTEEWLERHMHGYRARMSAAQNYAAGVFDGPITLFRASQTDAEVQEQFDEVMRKELENPTWGWEKLSTLPVETHDVSGNHSVILLEPNVRVLAERLTECINRAEKE